MGGNHLDVALILMSHFCSQSSCRGQTLSSGAAIVLSAQRSAGGEATQRNKLMATAFLVQIRANK